MYTNIIRFHDSIIFVYDGNFEDCIAELEKHFGKCQGWNIASGHGELWFSGNRKFVWDYKEKGILIWDTLAWGRTR